MLLAEQNGKFLVYIINIYYIYIYINIYIIIVHSCIRDAWKKLEGTSILEARHIYVEALLRAATEVQLHCIFF